MTTSSRNGPVNHVRSVVSAARESRHASSVGKRRQAILDQQADDSATQDCTPTDQLDSDAGQGIPLSFLAEAAALNANLDTPRASTTSTNVEVNNSHSGMIGETNTQYTGTSSMQQSMANEPGLALGANMVYDMSGRFDTQATKLLSINWIAHQYQTSFDPFDQLGDICNVFPTQFLDSSISLDEPNQENLNPSIVIERESAPDQPRPLDMMGDREAQSLLSDPGSVVSRDSHQSGSFFYVDGDGSRASLRPAFQDISSDQPRAHSHHERDPVTLAMEEVPFHLYQSLGNNLQSEYYDAIGSNVPSYHQVTLWVDLYYKKFHPTFPFLRRPKFWDEDNDWVLLLAVVTVGTSMSQTLDAERYRRPLMKILQQVVGHRFAVMRGQQDARTEWTSPALETSFVPDIKSSDLAVLQATVLSMLCLMHGGRNDEISFAMAERLKLVDACHSMRLLSKASVHHVFDSGYEPRAQCRAWYQHQAFARIGLMIWLLDFMIVCEFHCQPLLQLADATAPLPCNGNVWDSQIMDPNILQAIKPVPILEALEMIYMEKKLISDMSEFAKLILIYGICRRTKEVCLRSQSQLMNWTPSATIENRTEVYERGETWPPSSNLLSQWRNSACDCLDILHWSANSTALGHWGWEHPTIFHLHLSRLLILAPLRHIQTLATPSPSQDAINQPGIDRHAKSREFVLRWYLQDQYKARLSVVHAGALLWHCRRYGTRIFLEPYAIYIATLVLWAYSTALQFCQSRGSELQIFNNNVSLAASNTPGSNPSPQAYTDATDQDVLSVVVYLDRPIDDELVQTYIRWGSKMTACLSRVGDIANPSAPAKILKEAYRLLNLAGSSEARDYSVNECSAPSGEVVWGVRSSFAKSLDSLIRATQEHRY
ncbi:hypothetical protein E8E14_002499 [Neopestalotiopsis sp. 37M]|nr:hypothetical protein E8E14_002499 [Neopestalotiopsis sp. 37M]